VTPLINPNQFRCLKHYERAEVESGPIQNPEGVPSWPSFQTCMRKGLIERTARGLEVTAAGREALDEYTYRYITGAQHGRQRPDPTREMAAEPSLA
jgi:hypothetical protein